MKGEVILILGGTRSGKSEFAQKLARGRKVLFVATAEPEDAEMRERIEEHKRRRPSEWATLEAGRELVSKIESKIRDFDLIIIDCLTLFLARFIKKANGEELEEEEALSEIKKLISLIKSSSQSFILISNEMSMGVVPQAHLARRFLDLQGRVNQMLAECADRVYLMIAGIPHKIKERGEGDVG